jgi:hypothetical protein
MIRRFLIGMALVADYRGRFMRLAGNRDYVHGAGGTTWPTMAMIRLAGRTGSACMAGTASSGLRQDG